MRDCVSASNNAKMNVPSPLGPFLLKKKNPGTHLGLSLCVPVNVS